MRQKTMTRLLGWLLSLLLCLQLMPTALGAGEGLGWELLDDTDSRLTYAGQWVTQAAPGDKGGSSRYTSRGSVTLTFEGAGIRVYGSRQPNTPVTRVTLDGTVKDVATQDPTTLGGQLLFEKIFAENGTHTVSVSAPPAGTFIVFDALEIGRITDTSLRVASPTDRAVYQRDEQNLGHVPVRLATRYHGGSAEAGLWQGDSCLGTADLTETEPGVYTGLLSRIPAGGWYRLKVTLTEAGGGRHTSAVERVGVGDLFITGGQSQSVYGTGRTGAQTDTVSVFDPETDSWLRGQDPLPMLNHENSYGGGAPWNTAGDYLTSELGVPVGFVLTGHGGATVEELRTTYYPNLLDAIRSFRDFGGFRAILWHQGEADAEQGTAGEAYEAALEALIQKTREDAGFPVPWILANSAYLPTTGRQAQEVILRAQRAVAQKSDTDGIYLGPVTDDISPAFRGDGIHFNTAGLKIHGKRWARAVLEHLFDRTMAQAETTFIDERHPAAEYTGPWAYVYEKGQRNDTALTLKGAPGSVTLPFEGTGIRVLADTRTGQNRGASCTFTLDGGAPVLFETGRNCLQDVIFEAEALTPGTHTLTLTAEASDRALCLDGFEVLCREEPAPENLAPGRPAGAYTAHNFLKHPGFSIQGAFDGNMETAWATPGGNNISTGPALGATDLPSWLQVDLGESMPVDRVVVKELVFDRISRLMNLQILTSEDNRQWTLRAAGRAGDEVSIFDFPSVSARYIRVYLPEADGTAAPAIAEMEVYSHEHRTLPPMAALERAVFQRDSRNLADICIRNYRPGYARAQARLVQGEKILVPWTDITEGSCTLAQVPGGGWYSIQVRGRNTEAEAWDVKTAAEKVGVGEVFLISGQSNSACFGSQPTQAREDTVSTLSAADGRWYPCRDPQPSISDYIGTKGSAWPTLGDLLTRQLQVPVGFVLAGRGSAGAAEFLPGTGAYHYYLTDSIAALEHTGFRAILWHQGETDALWGTGTEKYAADLRAIIEATRQEAGFEVPWIVANAAFHPYPNATAQNQAAVRAGQQQVCADPEDLIFLGPDTDTMGPELRDPVDKVHFNHQGQLLHGKMWAGVILRELFHEELVEPPAPETELWDDTDSRITYEGPWSTWAGPEFYNSTVHYCDDQGLIPKLSYSFRFEGTGFSILQRSYENMLPLTVTLDGEVIAENLDVTARTDQYQKAVFTREDLDFGTHRVKVTSRPGNRADQFQLDAVRIFSLPAEEPDRRAARAVDDQIAALGEVTLDSEEAIAAARKAYEDLTEAQKTLVENLDALKAAEAKLQTLKDEADRALEAARAAALAELEKIDCTGRHEKQMEADRDRAAEAIRQADSVELVEALLEDASELLARTALCPSEDFKDVKADGWYHEAVDYAIENGLMKGVSADRFSINGTLTRGQLVTILYRAEGSPTVAGMENPFADIVRAPQNWYADAVIWAYHNGIVKGVTDVKFAPMNRITREQLVSILYRYDGSHPVKGSLKDFADGDKVSAYAREAMIWGVENGIVSGIPSGEQILLKPQGNATRAQAAAIMMRFLESPKD